MHIRTYIHTYIHLHICLYVHIWKYSCIAVCTHVYMCIRYVGIYVHTCVCNCAGGLELGLVVRKGLQFMTTNDKKTNRRRRERNLLIFNQYLWWLPSPCASARVSFLSTSAFLAFVVVVFLYVCFAVRFLNIVLHLNCYCFFCGFGANAAVAAAVAVAVVVAIAILLLLLFCSILVSPLGDARLTHACIINNCIISLCVCGCV